MSLYRPPIFYQLREATHPIDGFLTDREGWLLFLLASRNRGGCIVEIGSWQGKSTVWIGSGARRAGARVYAIDPHVGSEEHQKAGEPVWTFENFKENIRKAGLTEVVEPVVGYSQDVRTQFNQPIGMLFIDGAHDYDSVKRDYEMWSPLVREGGFIVFHDTQWPGVRRLCGEIFSRDSFRRAYFQDTICYGIKAAHASSVDRLRTKRMMFLNNLFAETCAASRSKFSKKMVKHYVKCERGLLTLLG